MASERWDRHFIQLALTHARMSKDPSTRVGAVIVDDDLAVRSAGFNGFPRGIADTPERLNDRDLKLSLVVHGEMNAVLAAARIGISVKSCTLYLACTNDSGICWGGPPCLRCAVELIQAGICEIVAPPFKPGPSKWLTSIEQSRTILLEAGVHFREVLI